MKGLSNKKFKATDWARPSIVVEGKLSVRDRKTLEEAASATTNTNGLILCIENEDGFHMVNPDSVELID